MGKADNTTKRFYEHLKCYDKTRRTSWIKSLLKLGKTPVLEIIDEVPIEHWQQWEVAWIEYFSESGCPLTNGTLGGDGGTQTLDTRKKMSEALSGAKNPMFGKQHREETKLLWSVNRRGKKRSPEAIKKSAASRIGIKLSDDHRKNISKAKSGKQLNPFTSQHLCNMSKAQAIRREREYAEKLLSMAQTARSN